MNLLTCTDEHLFLLSERIDIKRPSGKILWPAKSKRRENENPNLQQCLYI